MSSAYTKKLSFVYVLVTLKQEVANHFSAVIRVLIYSIIYLLKKEEEGIFVKSGFGKSSGVSASSDFRTTETERKNDQSNEMV